MPKIREPGTRPQPEKNTSEVQEQSITAEPKYDGKIRPGEIRNPLGKPPGTRDRLTKAFINDLVALHSEPGGKEALAWLRDNDPATWANVIAKVIPKEVDVDVEHHYGVADKPATADEWADEYSERQTAH